MEQQIKQLLSQVVHPETQQNIVESGVVDSIVCREDKITVVLCFAKARDPFAVKIKNLVENMLQKGFPAAEGNITVVIRRVRHASHSPSVRALP